MNISVVKTTKVSNITPTAKGKEKLNAAVR